MQEHYISGNDRNSNGCTKRLYYTDSYIKEFDAKVLACEEFLPKDGYSERISHRILLTATAFFPEGGGQYGDAGMLGSVRVIDTKEKDGMIWHYTDGPLAQGEEVHGVIDWDERFSRMQQHSGEHIVSGLVHKLKGYDNVGFHLGPFYTTLDFNGPLTEDELLWLENSANRVVADNIKFEVSFPDKEEEEKLYYRSKLDIDGQVRLVTIPGVDCCACCAPHVNRSGEVGLIRFADAVPWKGGVRLTILCGFRALSDYREKSLAAKQISNLLSAHVSDISEAVKRVMKKEQEAKQKLYDWQLKLVRDLPQSLSGCVLLFEPELDKNIAREYVNTAVQRGAGLAGVFTGSDEEGYSFILGSAIEDLRKLSEQMKTALNAKGGGKAEMIQGQVKAREESLRNFFLLAR